MTKKEGCNKWGMYAHNHTIDKNDTS